MRKVQENEAVIISASAKGHSFIYRTGAIQLEEKGSFSSAGSMKGIEAKDQMASTDSAM